MGPHAADVPRDATSRDHAGQRHAVGDRRADRGVAFEHRLRRIHLRALGDGRGESRSTITPGATIYCWEVGYSAADRRGVVLAQLADASTLIAEARSGANLNCSGEQPFAFTSAAFTYKR